jgi:hypothetical protein
MGKLPDPTENNNESKESARRILRADHLSPQQLLES